MRSRPGDPDRQKKCTGPAGCRVTAMSTTARSSTDPGHDPCGSGLREIVASCVSHLEEPLSGPVPPVRPGRRVRGAHRPCRRRPGCGRRRWPPSSPHCRRSCWSCCGRPPPGPRRDPHRPAVPGRSRAGPWSYGDGIRLPVRTGRATAGSTSRPRRVRRCGRPPRAGSPSRGRWPDAGWSPSTCQGAGSRRCASRTNRCGRGSPQATRWPPGRWWGWSDRSRPTAPSAACTGGCGVGTSIWIRWRCCLRHCCDGDPPGCCRCSVCRSRRRTRSRLSPVRRAGPWPRPCPPRCPAPRPRPARSCVPRRPRNPAGAWQRASARCGPGRRGPRRSW